MTNAIWDLDPWDSEGQFDYGPFFSRLTHLGFYGVQDIETDLADVKWMKIEYGDK